MLEMDNSLPLAGPAPWAQSNVMGTNELDTQAYTPIVWSADPDGPTVLTTPSPITLRPTFFTPLPQAANPPFPLAGQLPLQQQQPPRHHPSEPLRAGPMASAPVLSHSQMPPPPARFKMESDGPSATVTAAPMEHMPHPMLLQLQQQQQEQIRLQQQHEQEHHHQRMAQQRAQQQQQHQQLMGPSSATMHSSQMGCPPDSASSLFHPSSFGRMASASSDGSHAFTLDSSALHGPDYAQQQPRNWTELASHASTGAPPVHDPSMAGLFKFQHFPNVPGDSQIAANQAVLNGVPPQAGVALMARPHTGIGLENNGMTRAPYSRVHADQFEDQSSPFAHNCDPQRPTTMQSTFLAPSTASSCSQDVMETRLRTSPSENAGLGMNVGSSSADTLDKLRRPHTAAPQVSSKKGGKLFFQKNAIVGKADDGSMVSSTGDRERKQNARFVYKLYAMVHDPECQHLISWNSTGKSVVIMNFEEFSREVLGKHFKHSNFSSFIRQLNMYGFYKVNKIPRGSRTLPSPAQTNPEGLVWEFSHPKFQRNRPDLLDDIKRRVIENDTGRTETKIDMSPLAAQAQATAMLSNQVNELTVKVDELNVGLDKAGMRNAHLKELSCKLRDALNSSLMELRKQHGGALPEPLARHERLLMEAAEAISASDDVDMMQPAYPSSSSFVASPGWSLHARASTSNTQASAMSAPSFAEMVSSSMGFQDALGSAPSSFQTFPPRASQATITPFPRPSVLCAGPEVPSLSGPASSASSSAASAAQSRAIGTVDSSAATSALNTPSRSTFGTDLMEATALSRDDSVAGSASVANLATGLFGAPPSAAFSFLPPFSGSHAHSDSSVPPSLSSASILDAHTGIYNTSNASVDSVDQLPPHKQQRMMTPNTASSSSVVSPPPPRSSSLKAAFADTRSSSTDGGDDNLVGHDGPGSPPSVPSASLAGQGPSVASAVLPTGPSGVDARQPIDGMSLSEARLTGTGTGTTSSPPSQLALMSMHHANANGDGGVGAAASMTSTSLLSPSTLSLSPSSILPGGGGGGGSSLSIGAGPTGSSIASNGCARGLSAFNAAESTSSAPTSLVSSLGRTAPMASGEMAPRGAGFPSSPLSAEAAAAGGPASSMSMSPLQHSPFGGASLGSTMFTFEANGHDAGPFPAYPSSAQAQGYEHGQPGLAAHEAASVPAHGAPVSTKRKMPS